MLERENPTMRIASLTIRVESIDSWGMTFFTGPEPGRVVKGPYQNELALCIRDRRRARLRPIHHFHSCATHRPLAGVVHDAVDELPMWPRLVGFARRLARGRLEPQVHARCTQRPPTCAQARKRRGVLTGSWLSSFLRHKGASGSRRRFNLCPAGGAKRAQLQNFAGELPT